MQKAVHDDSNTNQSIDDAESNLRSSVDIY
jgi:hypothetical protein